MASQFSLISESGERIELDRDKTFGRGSSCDITVDDDQVSREHARFELSGGSVSLTDLGSANGTFVGDTRIAGSCILEQGDEIRFGPRKYRFDVAVPAGEDSEVTSFMSASEVDKALQGQGEADREGSQGTIVVLPRHENLPPAWDVDEGSSSTMVISRDAVDKMVADQEKAQEEIGRIEAGIDSATLLITSGQDSGLPYKLQQSSDTSFWVIGRDAESGRNSIVLDDPSVSDTHAKLVHKEGRWKIVDLMSTNHTYVNGAEYNSKFLASRDTIRFGAVSSVFLLPQKGAGDTAVDLPGGAVRKSLLARIFGWFRS